MARLTLIVTLLSLLTLGCSTTRKADAPNQVETRRWACVDGTAERWTCYEGEYDGRTVAREEPSADQEPLAEQEPSASQEPSVNREADKQPSFLIDRGTTNGQSVDVPDGVVVPASTAEQSLITDSSIDESDLAPKQATKDLDSDASGKETPDQLSERELQAALLAEPLGISGYGLSDEQALLNSPDSHYALQVIAARTASDVLLYIEKHASQFDRDVLSVKTRTQSGIWYVGVAAVYADYANAQSAVTNMTIPGNTWIRPVRGLKAAIRAAAQ